MYQFSLVTYSRVEKVRLSFGQDLGLILRRDKEISAKARFCSHKQSYRSRFDSCYLLAILHPRSLPRFLVHSRLDICQDYLDKELHLLHRM